MSTTGIRVVIDTNILVAIIGRKSPYRWIFECIIQGKLVLCVTNDIMLEYREVMEEKNGVEVAENVINFITANPFTEKIDIFYRFHLIADDEDDNKFVDCAISAGASCLVSNDGHFKSLKKIEFPKVIILTISEFESEYRSLLT